MWLWSAQNSIFSLLNVSFQPILSDLSLCSLTFSVLSPRILCVEENDLENIFIQLYASRNQTRVEWLNICCHQAIYKNILTLSPVYNRHN